MNICMVGYGMMGSWHSEALRTCDVVLHTVVGRRLDAAQEFAKRYGYIKATASFEEALSDPAVDVVIIGSPSEQHEDQAIRSLEAGKHTLIEIPIALTLAGAQRVVSAGEKSGKTYGLCHPMRFRREREALRDRVRAGEESIRHIAGRFFIKRLVNIGATGYRRSWIDNILWHHFCHFVDLGMYHFDGVPVRRVQSYMSRCHEVTGIPMECVVLVETNNDQTLLVHGSYHAAYRFYDKLIVTDRDTYHFDTLSATLRTDAGQVQMESEQANCARVVYDFLDAVKNSRPPRVSGPSVLPAMHILQTVQDQWDLQYGVQSIPGRAL